MADIRVGPGDIYYLRTDSGGFVSRRVIQYSAQEFVAAMLLGHIVTVMCVPDRLGAVEQVQIMRHDGKDFFPGLYQ